MIKQLYSKKDTEILYPESDNQLMADNTKQFRWIVLIKENLEILFANNPDVFVAGDLLWYPVEGNNKSRQAPDIMVVFGRPKGDRGSYQQWKEDNIAPQVVFEILSPGNRPQEMMSKLLFYQRNGVEEYYVYDPDKNQLTGMQKINERLEEIEEISGWISPRLNIRFELKENTLEIYYPNDRKFLTPVELDQLREQEYQRAEQERQAKEQALAQLQEEQKRYQALIQRLQQQGIDPNQL
ncbi:MAG: Uma2 family endonuclease [Chroococcales cyanobacterium]